MISNNNKKRTEHVIYANYDIYNEDYMKDAKEHILDTVFGSSETVEAIDDFGKAVTVTKEEYAATISDEQLYDVCNEWDRLWADEEYSTMRELDRQCNEIIAVADLGLWSGRTVGYKDYRHLQDIMSTDCDSEKIYVDGYGNLRKNENHHDGNNTILYRQWKDGITDTQKDNFRNKCYEGRLTKADITRYTESLGKLFNEYYGW